MPVYIYTPDQLLRIGLKLVGVDRHREKRQKRSMNIEDFTVHYGVDPIVCAQMWEDLQTTDIGEAKINAKSVDNLNSGCNVKNFLRAYHFLKQYETDQERKCTGDCAQMGLVFCIEDCRFKRNEDCLAGPMGSPFYYQCRWSSLPLPQGKVPNSLEGSESVVSQIQWSSLVYEVALSLYESKVVWSKGPLPAGANNDRKIYRSELRQKIPAGKKAVTNSGYQNRKDPKIAVPNLHDTEELRIFKARARMRQENFNN